MPTSDPTPTTALTPAETPTETPAETPTSETPENLAPVPDPTPIPVAQDGHTNSVQVWMRHEPDFKAHRLDVLKRDTAFFVMEAVINEKGELWYHVRLTDGREGYIFNVYVTLD